jgi:hypothetical protein
MPPDTNGQKNMKLRMKLIAHMAILNLFTKVASREPATLVGALKKTTTGIW